MPSAKQVRVRIPQRMQELIDGTISIEELDDEELIRGQLRDKHGQFTGQKPLLIPRSMHQAVVRELVERGDGKLKKHFDNAIEVHAEIMNNPRANPQARLEASRYIWERIAGKIPDKHIVNATVQKWEQMAKEVLVDIGDEDG